MEILSILIGLAIVGLAALVVGEDSRPRLDDEPHRAL